MVDSSSTPLLANSVPWRRRPYHRRWLWDEAGRLFDFFQYTSLNPDGGFYELDDAGQPLAAVRNLRQIHVTTRMIHCFALGSLLGRPGSDRIVDHGMRYLWEHHRDAEHGGYFWSLDADGPKDTSKQAYGHAFVLLAASDAKVLGHPLADAMLADITAVLEERFWDEQYGTVTEEFARDWSPISDYRGQNSNMHLTEALMAAFEATGDRSYLDKAESIAALIIGQHATALDYRVAEHFTGDWTVDPEYRGGDMFRPAGTTPGHWLEWSRLLLQLWVLGGQRLPWLPGAARGLFRSSIERGWDPVHGGFFYTLDWDNKPELRQKLWWPVAEAIGAAAWLCQHDPSDFHEGWYRKLWDFAANHLIDHERGGWLAELSEDLRPGTSLFTGKPDLYHALQATLIPLFPAGGSLTRLIPQAATER